MLLRPDWGCLCSETPSVLFTNTHLLPLNYGFDSNLFILDILKEETKHVLTTVRKETNLKVGINIDTNRIGNITKKYFFKKL
jgi:hypothetical protein